jgi:hypothetical protein
MVMVFNTTFNNISTCRKKEKGQKEKQQSTKHTNKTKYIVK